MLRWPISHEDFERWACGRHWQFARTQPQNPHEYTHRAWGHEETFLRIVLHLREYGRQEVYGGDLYTYYVANGFKHWTMGADLMSTILINRKLLGQDEGGEKTDEQLAPQPDLFQTKPGEDMTEADRNEILVALYDRLSTKRQGEVGYAEEGHVNELCEQLAKMIPPRRSVEEIPEDPGEKRWMHDRPGVRRLKELASTGGIEEVWAWSWERYGQSPVPELLSLELNEHGVTMRSLDDGGEGFGGEIVRAVRSVISGQDMRDRVRKSAMGKRAKARKGHVLGAGPKPRYGFRLVRDEKGKAIRYEPHETEMAVVRRIVGWLAEGRSLYFVQTTLEAEGVPAPQGREAHRHRGRLSPPLPRRARLARGGGAAC